MAPFDFLPSDKVRTPKQYAGVFKSNNRRYISGKWFNIVVSPNSQINARLGLIVSKKWSKSAVKRNLVKRVVRECFRLKKRQLPCVDMVVMAKHKFTDEQRQAMNDKRYCIKKMLREDINRLWKQIAAL